MKDRIYLSSPHMGGGEMKYIQEAFDTNWIAPLGKNVTEFENEMCRIIGRNYAVALSSGTAAIHLGLKYLGVGEDDVVFCSSFTFSGSCNPIKYLKAKPVFIDCDYKSFNMCPKALEKAYEKYSPKAVIVVNLYGNSAEYDEILKITRAHNTPVLEDAAESLGATYKGIQTGNFGDISVFSFNGNKIMTTSGGGMAMVNDKAAREKILFWATQSRENFAWYQHEEVGYNYRLSNICAGIGRGQAEVLPQRVARKREINEIYKNEFRLVNEIKMIPVLPDCVSNCWLSGITLQRGAKTNFMDIIKSLEQNNIESRPAWKPMHTQPVFAGTDFFTCFGEGGKEYSEFNGERSVCEDIFSRAVCLPSDTKMTDEQVKTVADIVKNAVKRGRSV